MSRSYRKAVKLGIAVGDNRKFYKIRRKLRRRRMRHELNNLKSKYDAEGIDENVVGDTMFKEAQWLEPTDGHYGLTKNMIRLIDKDDAKSGEWFHKRFDRYLKSKHKKH